MGWLANITRVLSSAVGKAAEGQYRPGPYYLPVTHGWLPASWGQSMNWWQNGHTPLLAGGHLAIIEACLSAYSQTVAMCPGEHWKANAKGGRDRVTTSSLSRILRTPNDYQTASDFLLNAVRQLYFEGNAYALCMRNARYEIEELHLMDNRYTRAYIDGQGDVHYALGGNWVVQNRYGPLSLVPARDVMHIKLHVDQLRNPLRGESPLVSAYLDVLTGGTIRAQAGAFYGNQAKPGFVLSTDLLLDKDQVSAVRDRWNEQTTGENIGGTPILTGGLKPVQIPMATYRDSQIAELLKLTDQDIAMAFRVPMPILGISSGPYGSTESLMQAWVASGLGFCLNHVEEAFDQTFGLKGQPDEYVEFDTEALLRSAYKDRIEALVRGVQGGVYSPNEARNKENLNSVKDGDEPRVQQQVVPLSAAGSIPTSAPGKTKIPASPPAPSAPPAPGPPLGSKQDAATTRRDSALGRVILSRHKQLRRARQRDLLIQ